MELNGLLYKLRLKNAKKIIATLYYYKSNYDYTRKNIQATSKEEKKY